MRLPRFNAASSDIDALQGAVVFLCRCPLAAPPSLASPASSSPPRAGFFLRRGVMTLMAHFL